MVLQKLNLFTKKVSDLSDKPNATMTAAEVKAQFDAAPNEVRVYLNQLIDALQSGADGDSGADNIKATAITGVTGNTVQSILEGLKLIDDSLLSQLQNISLGQIPDGTINDVKLSNAGTEIKQQFATHKVDDVKHVTQSDKDKWNAADVAKFKKGSSTFTDNDTSQTFTDAFCTVNGLVTVVITGSNPQGVWSVTSADGSFTITSTVAESNDITFDYFIQKAVG